MLIYAADTYFMASAHMLFYANLNAAQIHKKC